MDLNKAVLCGRLQQTGPGWAQDTPGRPGAGGGTGWAGSPGKYGLHQGERGLCDRQPLSLPCCQGYTSRWQKWAESTVNYFCPT